MGDGPGLAARGHAIIGTFAPEGQLSCGGLPVARYDETPLCGRLGESNNLVKPLAHDHKTPKGGVPGFHVGLFRKAFSCAMEGLATLPHSPYGTRFRPGRYNLEA